MKRSIALLLCVLLLVSVTACGKPQEDTPATSTTQSTTTTATTAGEDTVTTTTTAASDTAAPTTTTVATGADGTTTVTPPTADTTAPTVAPTGTSSAPVTTTPTKAPSASATVSTPTSTTKPTSATKPTTTTTTSSVSEPKVVLPAVGSDIDVVKKKDRIRVSAASAVYNADGTIAVSLTFKNYSSNWITEETDWVEYTCYDKNGNVVQTATKISIGCIDTKKNPVKTFTFEVPAATAEVRLTNCKIVYWTEWS